MSQPPQELNTKEQWSQLVDSCDNVLFDCDGVLWSGDVLLSGVAEVLTALRQAGKKLFFVTNNATKSREQLVKKFTKLGVDASLDEMYGSAFATAAYLKYSLKFPEDKYVYIIGEQGLEHELDAVGVKHKGGSDPDDNVLLPSMEFDTVRPDPEVGAVLCGFDMKINYKKLGKAYCNLLHNSDCLFILTNDDSTFPQGGTFYPGSGAISAGLRYALPDKNPIVVGKPNQPMLDAILKRNNLDRSRTLMVGDRLNTDIDFGIQGGLKTLLVLTGVSQKADYEKPGAPTVPHFVANSLGQFA